MVCGFPLHIPRGSNTTFSQIANHNMCVSFGQTSFPRFMLMSGRCKHVKLLLQKGLFEKKKKTIATN